MFVQLTMVWYCLAWFFFAYARSVYRAQRTHLLALYDQMGFICVHFRGNRHTSTCSCSLNARYACKLDDIVTTTAVPAAAAAVNTVALRVSNEIIFETRLNFGVLLPHYFFSVFTVHTIQWRNLFRNAHARIHTRTYRNAISATWQSRFLQLNFWLIFFCFCFCFGPQNKANDTKCAKQRKLFILDRNQYTILCVCVSVSARPRLFFILVAYLIVKKFNCNTEIRWAFFFLFLHSSFRDFR